MRRIRFVGGPCHGEIRMVQDSSPVYRVPVYDRPSVATWCGEFLDADTMMKTRVTEVRYVRRPLGLGPWARVELWAPEDMQEPEFMRRVADLLEGVGEKVSR